MTRTYAGGGVGTAGASPFVNPVEARRLQHAANFRQQRETVDALVRAADLLERDGWHRGSLRDSKGRRDVLAALEDATEELGPLFLAQDKLATELGLPDPDELATEARLARWNDGMEDRRAVVRAMRRTARKLGAEL